MEHGPCKGDPRHAGEDVDRRQATPFPSDEVDRGFHALAPNRLWASDLTHVAIWACLVSVAFVLAAKASRTVVWRARSTAHAGFVLNAPEQALRDRRRLHGDDLIRLSDRGTRDVSIACARRLVEGRVEPSVGSVGNSYDDALAATINGLHKAEVLHRSRLRRSFEAAEGATVALVDRFIDRRHLQPIGSIPLAEADARHYALSGAAAMVALRERNGLGRTRRG